MRRYELIIHAIISCLKQFYLSGQNTVFSVKKSSMLKLKIYVKSLAHVCIYFAVGINYQIRYFLNSQINYYKTIHSFFTTFSELLYNIIKSFIFININYLNDYMKN